MRFLGKLCGAGSLRCGEQTLGRAEYELDGYVTHTGEVVASGELRMSAESLDDAFGRNDLSLATDDGRVLKVRFSGRQQRRTTALAAHVDVSGEGLPPARQWRR
jgi:hypothetical protein